MKKIVFAIVIVLSLFSVRLEAVNYFPQDLQVIKPQDDIKSLFEAEEYEAIIERYAGQPRVLSADELVYVAKAYYKLDDVPNSKTYLDLALRKDAKCPQAYYFKGVIAFEERSLDEAANQLKKALAINPAEGKYYTYLGEIYEEKGDYNKAFEFYNKALQQPQPSERTYFMIASAYALINDMEKSLQAFYTAKQYIVKDKELYASVLYNIGDMEFNRKNYDKAIDAYKELIEFFSDDYQSYTKLVQSYNALGDYKTADFYKKILYKAHKRGELDSTELAKMFCVEQFTVGDKMISVYEYFDNDSKSCDTTSSFVPVYQFYILNSNDDIESTLEFGYMSDNSLEITEYELVKRDGQQVIQKLGTFTSREYSKIKDAVAKKI